MRVLYCEGVGLGKSFWRFWGFDFSNGVLCKVFGGGGFVVGWGEIGECGCICIMYFYVWIVDWGFI